MDDAKLYSTPKPRTNFKLLAGLCSVMLLTVLFIDGGLDSGANDYTTRLIVVAISVLGLLLSLKIRYIELYKDEIKVFYVTGWVMFTAKYSDLSEVVQKESGWSKRFIVKGVKKKIIVWESEFGPIAYQSLLGIIVSKVNT